MKSAGSMKNAKIDHPVLSIVIPAFNEQGNLIQIYSELKETLSSLKLTWEIVFIDDGSTDDTWDEIVSLNNDDMRVQGLRLSRNFGHQNALVAGLEFAQGDAIISMDSDMQHPPELIPRLVQEWQGGHRIVKTIRHDRDDLPIFKRYTSRIYYRLFSYLSGVKIENGMSDFRLLDRQVLNEVLRFREEGLFLRGIVQWVGYPSTTVSFDCGTRFSGQSKYTLYKMIKFAWHGISSFSLVPLRIATLVGLTSSAIAFFSVLYAIISKWMLDGVVSGWASSVAILSFLFGMLFIFLAVLAEYMGRILEEVRGRPRFIVSESLQTRTNIDSVDGSEIDEHQHDADMRDYN